ncbi:hypothetical protein FB451DRAFT_1453756 [Mycena latifolia]|nr:hypothetical protein FB451DRAFT_1453756 [Mycena latifolia]
MSPAGIAVKATLTFLKEAADFPKADSTDAKEEERSVALYTANPRGEFKGNSDKEGIYQSSTPRFFTRPKQSMEFGWNPALGIVSSRMWSHSQSLSYDWWPVRSDYRANSSDEGEIGLWLATRGARGNKNPSEREGGTGWNEGQSVSTAAELETRGHTSMRPVVRWPSFMGAGTALHVGRTVPQGRNIKLMRCPTPRITGWMPYTRTVASALRPNWIHKALHISGIGLVVEGPSLMGAGGHLCGRLRSLAAAFSGKCARMQSVDGMIYNERGRRLHSLTEGVTATKASQVWPNVTDLLLVGRCSMPMDEGRRLESPKPCVGRRRRYSIDEGWQMSNVGTLSVAVAQPRQTAQLSVKEV